MSNATDIAEHSSILGVAAVCAVTGASSALAPFAGSLAVLAAIGIALRHKGAKRSCATAEARARTALASSTDFTEANHARAKTLIAEARHPVTLNPAELRAASRQDGFNEHLAETLLSTVPFAADDDGPRAILHLSLTAAIAAYRADDAFHRDLTQEMLLQAARDAGLQIDLLQDIKEDTSALRTMMEQMLASQTANAARDQGLSEAAVIGLAKGIAPTVRDFDEAMTALGEAVQIANRLTTSGDAGSNIEPFVDRVLHELARLTRAGEFDAAAEAARDAVDQAEAGLAQIINAAIDAQILARNADGAAALIVKRITLDTPPDLFEALRAERRVWYERGRDKGLRLDLEVAIALARSNKAHATTPDQIGTALNVLGAALATLGARETDTTRLEQAVDTYRAALTKLTQDRVPLDWAATQNNLGIALSTLGQREAGTARLEQAVTAYRAALTECTQGRVPLGWATTQNNLGTALQALGEREAGTARLEQAVDAFRAALTERTQGRVPLDWAMTQNNLGNALQTLGQRETDTTRLEQAVDAYRAALTERKQDRVPLGWAMSTGNLGIALSLLAERTNDDAMAQKAIAQIREAEQAMRDGQHIPAADYYAEQLPLAEQRLAEITARRT